MNNRRSNLKGNIYDLWVIWRLCSKVCESKSDNPWQNICDSDDVEKSSIRDKPIKYELWYNKTIDTTNNTTPNLTIIRSTWNKLACPNPNLTTVRIITAVIKSLICEGCECEI